MQKIVEPSNSTVIIDFVDCRNVLYIYKNYFNS